MERYLLLNASTTSEWDSCSFMLVEMTKKRVGYIDKLREFLLKGKDLGVAQVIIYSDEADFFMDEEELPAECRGFDDFREIPIINEGFYQFDKSFLDKLTRPQQEIRYGKVKITEFDTSWISYGKHTDEEFSATATLKQLKPAEVET